MKIQLALAAVKLSIARKYVKKWNKNGIGVQAVRRFLPKTKQRGYRLYIPIKPKKTAKVVPPPAILHAITSAGYRIDDYVTGIAVDSTGKRRIRMGKLLKDAELLKEFVNDPQRSAHKDEFTCVISCHPYDVIGMSTGRRWDMTSCMRLDQPGVAQGGVYKEKVKVDVAEGTIVAYAVSPKDKNIEKPHARLLIKPFYRNVNGRVNRKSVLFRVETKVYGTPIPGFMETVSAWLRKVNKIAETGAYTLAPELYDDGVGQFIIHSDFKATPDAEKFKYLNEHREEIAKIIRSDVRWLGAVLPNASRLYSSNGNTGIQAVNLMDMLGKAVGLGITHKEIGQQIEKFMPEEDLLPLAKLIVNDSLQPVTKYSARLKKAVDSAYAFDPESPNMSTTEILTKRAYWDSRWLSKIEDVPEEYGAGNTFLAFIRKRLEYTPELRKSKASGSVALCKYLGLMFRIAAKSSDDEFDSVVLARKLVKKFPVDTYFDPEIHKMMGRIWAPRMKRVIGKISGETAQGLLCAVDKSWPSQDLELIADGGEVILRKEVFENLVKINTEDAEWALATQLKDQQRSAPMTETAWSREYPWTMPFIKKVARGPYPPSLMAWAQRYIDEVARVDKEMDDIFAELGDLGMDE